MVARDHNIMKLINIAIVIVMIDSYMGIFCKVVYNAAP